MQDALVFDTPEKIEGYRLIATYHGLKMELNVQLHHGFPPTACPTRGRALRTAQSIIRKYELGPAPRTRKGCLAVLEPWLKERGLVR